MVVILYEMGVRNCFCLGLSDRLFMVMIVVVESLIMCSLDMILG